VASAYGRRAGPLAVSRRALVIKTEGGIMPLSSVLEVESPEHEFDDEDWEEDEEFGTDDEELELDELDEGLEEDDEDI
jgi:hypothetical protein